MNRKIEKSKSIVGILLIGLLSWMQILTAETGNASNNNLNVESFIIEFYQKYISDYDYSSEISLPESEISEYTILIKQGERRYLNVFIEKNSILIKSIAADDQAIALEAGRRLAVSIFDKQLSNISFFELARAEGSSSKIYAITPSKDISKKRLENEAITKTFYRKVAKDISIIQNLITSLPHTERRDAYQATFNDLILRSIEINQYRQRVWNTYTTDLGLNLDRAIDNALPGVKSKTGSQSDTKLIAFVNEFIQGNESHKSFDEYLENTIKKRVAERTKYDIDNYVRNIIFQLDFLRNDIIEWRDKMNKYGGSSNVKNKKLNSYANLLSVIPKDNSMKLLTETRKIPKEVALFLSDNLIKNITDSNVIEINHMPEEVEPEQIALRGDPVLQEEKVNIEVEAPANDQVQDEKEVYIEEEVYSDPEVQIEEYLEEEIVRPGKTIEIVELDIPILEESDKNKQPAIVEPLAKIPKKSTMDIKKIIESKSIESFNSILASNSNLSIKSEHGGNIYHLLPNKISDLETIQLLSEKAEGINEKDDFGNTPLYYAMLMGDNKLAKALIYAGADLKIRNEEGFQVLHLAALSNDAYLTQMIVAKDVDINASAIEGYTALHIGVELAYPEITKILLTNGADNKDQTIQGLRVKDIAKIQANSDIGKLIKAKGYYPISENQYLTGKEALLKRDMLAYDEESKYPLLIFDLPYDNYLVSERAKWKTIKRFSIPVFVLSASASAYMHYKANDSFDRYQTSITDADASFYYDQTGKYDMLTYISGGLSVVSLYFTINSGLKVSKIERQLKRFFY